MNSVHRRDQLAYIEALVGTVDAAVDVSGFLFSDQRGRASSPLIPLVEAFERRGKPFVFLPQAWGPFEQTDVRTLARRAVAAATLSFARDDVSHGYLRALGASGQVEQAPDIAFLFQPSPNGDQLVADLGLDPDRPIASIAPNMRVYERTGGEGIDNVYGQALTRVGQSLLDRDVQILLVPHEILPPVEDRQDDRYLCTIISKALGTQDVVAVTEDRSAEDLKAMIGASDLMLGSRFHALIAALSSGVPSVAVGWAHKYPELLGEFGHEHLVVDHNSLTAADLETAVLRVWDARGEMRDAILETLPSVKQRSAHAFDRTRAVLLGAA